MVVKWSRLAATRLQAAYDYIVVDSFSNAEKIRNEIIRVTSDLPRYPERYPPDKYKETNNGDFRVFEKYRYRISYWHKPHEIVIVRVRHTSKRPVLY